MNNCSSCGRDFTGESCVCVIGEPTWAEINRLYDLYREDKNLVGFSVSHECREFIEEMINIESRSPIRLRSGELMILGDNLGDNALAAPIFGAMIESVSYGSEGIEPTKAGQRLCAMPGSSCVSGSGGSACGGYYGVWSDSGRDYVRCLYYKVKIDGMRETYLKGSSEKSREKTMGVRFYKNQDTMGIDTDLTDENEFMNASSSGLAKAIMDVGDEAEQAYVLRQYMGYIIEIVCKLRGYKADVQIKQLIAAGNIMPDAIPVNVEVNDRKQVVKQ